MVQQAAFGQDLVCETSLSGPMPLPEGDGEQLSKEQTKPPGNTAQRPGSSLLLLSLQNGAMALLPWGRDRVVEQRKEGSRERG